MWDFVSLPLVREALKRGYGKLPVRPQTLLSHVESRGTGSTGTIQPQLWDCFAAPHNSWASGDGGGGGLQRGSLPTTLIQPGFETNQKARL